MEYADIIKAELIAHDINLCTGCDSYNSHARGYATPDDRTIHCSAKGATRMTLCKFLHEIGHIVKGHGAKCKLRRYEREEQAEAYAKQSMKDYGIPMPRKRARRSASYVNRMKRWGNNIARGRQLALS